MYLQETWEWHPVTTVQSKWQATKIFQLSENIQKQVEILWGKSNIHTLSYKDKILEKFKMTTFSSRKNIQMTSVVYAKMYKVLLGNAKKKKNSIIKKHK